jgi:hypothetical protein
MSDMYQNSPPSSEEAIRMPEKPKMQVPQEGSFKVRRVERPVSRQGPMLRARIVDPSDPNYEVKVLVGKNMGSPDIRRLLQTHQVKALMNGTFFEGRTPYSDIVGFSNTSPDIPSSPPFYNRNPQLQNQIMKRFYLAIDHQDRPVSGLRADLLDEKGQFVAPGKSLSPYFKMYIGGGALIDFEDSDFRKALDSNNAKQIELAFNRANHRYNRKAAFDGIDGSMPISRTALGIIRQKTTQKPLLVMMTIGNGARRDFGVTLPGLVREFKALTKETLAEPLKILVLDSASSTMWGESDGSEKGNPTVKVHPSSRHPNTAVALVPRKRLNRFA